MGLAEVAAEILDRHSTRRTPSRPLSGVYVIGATSRDEAICLSWGVGGFGVADRLTLRGMYEEARHLGLRGRIHVHGSHTPLGETATFTFYQEASR